MYCKVSGNILLYREETKRFREDSALKKFKNFVTGRSKRGDDSKQREVGIYHTDVGIYYRQR
jgi:hypothetical protein